LSQQQQALFLGAVKLAAFMRWTTGNQHRLFAARNQIFDIGLFHEPVKADFDQIALIGRVIDVNFGELS
jgi:hypothetical protein